MRFGPLASDVAGGPHPGGRVIGALIAAPLSPRGSPEWQNRASQPKDCGKTAADLERTEMPSDQTPADLGWKLPRLDSNQQPFGEQPLYDGVRPQTHNQGKQGFPYDHSRPESTGFNCGKTAADHGRLAGVHGPEVTIEFVDEPVPLHYDPDIVEDRDYRLMSWPTFISAIVTLALAAGIVWWVA